MLRQKCSYKGTLKLTKSWKAEKKATKVCNLTKTIKAKLLTENAGMWWLQ